MSAGKHRSQVALGALVAVGLLSGALSSIPAGAGSDPSAVKQAIEDHVTMRMEPGGFAGNVGDHWDATVVIKTKFSETVAFEYDCCKLIPRSSVAQKGEVHNKPGVLRPGLRAPSRWVSSSARKQEKAPIPHAPRSRSPSASSA